MTTRLTLDTPIVQISLDLTSLAEALEMAEIAVAAGVDWLEAGTPLLLARRAACGRDAAHSLPRRPIVADLKTMDGGYLEAEMMAQGGRQFRRRDGPRARGDDPARRGRRTRLRHRGDGRQPRRRRSRRQRALARALGVDFVIHHIGFDERRLVKGLSPLDELDEIVRAVSIPVQAVGGLSIARRSTARGTARRWSCSARRS